MDGRPNRTYKAAFSNFYGVNGRSVFGCFSEDKRRKHIKKFVFLPENPNSVHRWKQKIKR